MTVSRDRDTVTAVTAVQAGKGPARDSVLLGKYRVEATLGFGGMGLVIRAHNLALDEKVAIKFLREDVQIDEEHVERFLREAKAAVRLKSEHVAKIRDVGTLEDGRPYMVMEFLEGLDLGRLLVDQGSIEPARAVDLVLQTCDGLAEAHALGIVHRDIKPTNLFVTRRRDGSELLKVLDFGISKAQAGTEMSLTQTSSVLGTPAYMSPEQMRSARTVDARSDIWALGTVLYELIEGRPPFEATNFAELCVMVTLEPCAPMSRAPELSAVMERCLAKSVADRYQNVAELAADLEPFAPDPGRAQRQVARIRRVLGLGGSWHESTPIPGTPLPHRRDSTPLPPVSGRHDATPTPRRDSTRLPPQARDATPMPRDGAANAFAPAPTVLVERAAHGVFKIVALLVVLFGVGIAGGLLLIDGGSTPPASSPGEAAATPSGSDRAHAATDAGLAATALADGSVAPSTELSGTEPTTDQRSNRPERPLKRFPPTRRQPFVRKPRTAVPPHPTPPPGPGNTAPVVKQCDPFDNSHGCE
jgi:eukaryotic-like serine/threonine-protein kinase